MMEIHELANAWTMVPFFYFTWYAKTLPQSILITLMWMSSMHYHLYYAVHQYTLGHYWHLLDCTFQVASLLVLVLEAPAYNTHPSIKHAASMVFTLLLGWMWGIAYVHCLKPSLSTTTANPADPASSTYPFKETVFHSTLVAHALHLLLCVLYAPHRSHVSAALQTLLPFPFLIHASHREEGRHWWSVGHGILFWYTYHCWNALGMLRTT